MIDALLLAIVAATPLILAVQGELLLQRSGIINLGLEAMLLTAAMTSVIATQISGSVAVGFAGGVAGAAFIAAVFGLFAIHRRGDQIVTGTAVNFLAAGMTGFLYRELQNGRVFGRAVPRTNLDAVVVLAWIVIPIALGFLLWRTRYGLRLRACGENPEAVAALRVSVAAYRWSALGGEAILAGIGGAHLALALSSGFAENMTAGRGFIALSIVIFGRWHIRGAVAGTAVFGIAAAAQYALQAAGTGLPFHLLLATPYVVTLLILCGVAGRIHPPEALGKN